MYGLETIDAMNDREMKQYHKEQKRKKQSIKNAMYDAVSEYFNHPKSKHIENCDVLLDCIDKEIDKLDLENREDL